jgi:predicted dehydrogenase
MGNGLSRRSFLATGTAGLAMLPGVAQAAKGAKTKIRIGQIGIGHAHASKLSVYRDSPDYEVVGIVEPDTKLKEKLGNQPLYQDLKWMSQEELLNQPGLQAVLVETRVRDSLDVAKACVDAGMHVHIDKPAGDSLSKLSVILGLAEKQKLLVQMGYMYRYNPAILMLKQFLREGWLGDVFEIHTVMSKVVDGAARLELAQYPGGVMFELGCHILDLVVDILGEPKAVTPFAQHAGGPDDSLVDNMLAVLEYPEALATVKSSAQEVEGFARRHFVICGTEGTFHIQPLDNPKAQVALAQARGAYRKGYQDITFPKFERYVADAADMAKIIRGEKNSDFSYAHDLAVQRTLFKSCRLNS